MGGVHCVEKETHSMGVKKNTIAILFSVMGALLVLLLFTNWYAYEAVFHEYEQRQWLQLFPIGQLSWALNTSGGSNDVSLLMLGDSRVKHWSTLPEVEGSILNAGEFGFTSAQLLLKLQSTPLPVAPSYVLLEIGINDLKTIGVFPEKKQAIVENCFANIKGILRILHSYNSEIILLTVFQPGEPEIRRRPFWDEDIYQAVQEFNQRLLDLNEGEIHVIDCDKVLSKQGRLNSEYAKDCMHLNEKGYSVLNAALKPVLSEIMATR